MNDRSHLKRFKDAKKELRGHKVAFLFLQYLEYWYHRGDKNGAQRVVKGTQKEFRLAEGVFKCGKQKTNLFDSKFTSIIIRSSFLLK